MTRENENLLLKVLSEQFPYGVLILDTAAEKYGKLYQINSDFVWYDCQETEEVECQSTVNVKPYLRPMSSMTDEESKEYRMFIDYSYNDFTSESFPCVYVKNINDYLDWLNAHHFDYRGLIEKGLALEAPEGMHKNE